MHLVLVIFEFEFYNSPVAAVGGGGLENNWKTGRKSGHAWALVAARALATYLIPGCVGRGLRLGSESSSGPGGGAAWKSGNLEI